MKLELTESWQDFEVFFVGAAPQTVAPHSDRSLQGSSHRRVRLGIGALCTDRARQLEQQGSDGLGVGCGGTHALRLGNGLDLRIGVRSGTL